ncbi:MAG TPA: MaoC/PaaZ C-terminal domain-containing protein [Solirubrobacteraceae bacterium]|jgi:acyl dehydratase
MRTRTLSSPPRILPLYARATAPLLPGASLLPFVGGRGNELPELELVLENVRVDRDRLAAYAHVCGFSLRDTLPATFPHVLAFGLQLALMTDSRFPFPAIGVVHLSNRIVQRRPIDLGEALQLRVRTGPLSPHRRGRTFAIITEARVEGELVWEEHSTMLRRGGGSEASESTGAEADAGTPLAPKGPASKPAEQTALWQLPGDLGRRYAAVSGDRNPIHMHALSARLFGFPRAIAHGMWTKARCLAALEQQLPDAFAVEVDFRKPIALPGEVAFGAEPQQDGGVRFAVQDRKETLRHLDGVLEPLAEAGGGSADEDPAARGGAPKTDDTER